MIIYFTASVVYWFINKNPPIARGKIKGETPSCSLNKYPSKLMVNTTAKKAAS
jgi:hypothetical protein